MIDRLELHAYADDELSSEERSRIEHELAGCPESQREVEAIRGLRNCLQTKLESPSCAQLWKSCAGRLDELDSVKKAESFVSKYAWGLSLLLFLVIAGGGLMNRVRGGSVNMGGVASMASEMIPIQSSPVNDAQPLGNWIETQTGERPALVADPARVVGLAYTDRPEGRIIQVQMIDSVGAVNLIVIPRVTRVEGARPMGEGMYAGQVNGMNCVTWADSGCAIIAIGGRGHEQLREFAQSLYR